MAKKKISITISPDAHKVSIEGHGFRGKTCDKYMGPFERRLFGEQAHIETQFKPEYDQELAAPVTDTEIE